MIGDSAMSKKIPLTQGKFAIVDDEDYEELNKYKWQARIGANTYYAYRGITKNGKTKILFMHEQIMNPPKNMDTDHIDRNGLNNRRSNLRICSRSQNMHNIVARGKTSKYKGVSWEIGQIYKGKQYPGRWRAGIKQDYKTYHLGSFNSEIEAAKAYDRKAIELYKEFANTNFNKSNYGV